MLDETEGDVSTEEKHLAFNRKPVWVRMAIICAGPFSNIVCAFVSFWLVFVIGVYALAPVLGTAYKGTVANFANIQSGLEIISVNEHLTLTWEDVSVAIMLYLGKESSIKIKAYDIERDMYSEYVLDLTDWAVSNTDGDILKSLGNS